jgi:hypothetical protein
MRHYMSMTSDRSLSSSCVKSMSTRQANALRVDIYYSEYGGVQAYSM